MVTKKQLEQFVEDKIETYALHIVKKDFPNDRSAVGELEFYSALL